jgi:protein-S-isoprenylcysteine O-methyltransferase Ste14
MGSALRWLARRRVTLGFVCAIVAMLLAEPTPRSVAAGALVALAGKRSVCGRGHLEKGREVTTTGPYRLTRHPLYLGSTIIGVGVALASANAIVAALVLGYLVVTLTAAIRTEESHLTDKFGAAYPRTAKDARRKTRDASASSARCAIASIARSPVSRSRSSCSPRRSSSVSGRRTAY